MIEHVYRRTAAARSISSVIVATDDERIFQAVRAFGGDARMTSRAHQSGTDRIAEIAAGLTCTVVVNVQGDEPLIEPEMIDEAVTPFSSHDGLMMSTLRRRIDDEADRTNPNVVKMVVDRNGFALYFSRAALPYTRQGCPPAPAWRHVGLYVYRRECLMELAALPATDMERAEALEQLRALEHGIRIKAVETRFDSVSVDTPEDLERVRGAFAAQAGAARTGNRPQRAESRRDSTPRRFRFLITQSFGQTRGDTHTMPQHTDAIPQARDNESPRPVKYIFVTGGVVSSLGKGLAAASIGALLEGHGYKVALQKFDPYINVDPGTMSPYQHGEVYVTDDGAETDLDLGHYERFTNQVTTRNNNWTTGKIYLVGHSERAAGRLSGPDGAGHPAHHQRNQGQHSCGRQGTSTSSSSRSAGRSETSRACRFVEAIRQLRQDVGRENTLYIHLTLVPFIGAAGELKTKPTQHSVRDLRAIGIQPDILLCRTDRFLDQDIKQKIALFCDVDEEAVITAKDVSSIYEVPLVLAAEGLDRIVLNRLHLPQTEAHMDAWVDLVDRIKNPSDEITIHVVGKYVGYEDSYKSLNEALYHGGFKHRLRVNIRWVEAEALEQPGGEQLLEGADGILVPGGFGDRGTRGMMRAAEIARERGIPYFGICYGFQWAAVEYARHVCGHDARPIRPNARPTRRRTSSTSCAICSASTTWAGRCGSAPTRAS